MDKTTLHLYNLLLDHLNFTGNPADSPEDLQDPVYFDNLFFEKEVFDELIADFKECELYDLSPETLQQLNELIESHTL